MAKRASGRNNSLDAAFGESLVWKVLTKTYFEDLPKYELAAKRLCAEMAKRAFGRNSEEACEQLVADALDVEVTDFATGKGLLRSSKQGRF